MDHSKLSIDVIDIHNYPAYLNGPPTANSSDVTLLQRPQQANPFVGRLGGNRAFSLDVADPNYDRALRSAHGAGPPLTWKGTLDPREFLDGELWKQAILEGWGTSLLVWLTGVTAYSLVPTVS